MRGGSLTNSGCGQACIAHQQSSWEQAQDALTSLLSAKVQTQARWWVAASSYSTGASSQLDTVTVCGSWAWGVTSSWNCISRSVDPSVQ